MPFDPTSISGCKLWLKADSISAIDGDTPPTWGDQSGNAFDATLTAVVYKTAILNSKPVLRFDGSSSFGDLGTPAGLELYTAFTIATVFRTVTTPGGTNAFVVAKDFSTGARGYGVGVSSSGHVYIETGGFPASTSDGPGVVDGVGHIEIFSYDGVNGTSHLDGSLVASFSVGAFTANASAPWNIGRRAYVGVSSWYTGDVAEVVVYNSSLGSTDRTSLTNYLASKYALAGGSSTPCWWNAAGSMMGNLSISGGR